MTEYNIVAGTFDRLHDGHKRLLKTALIESCKSNRRLVVGIMNDEYAKNKYQDVQPFKTRSMVVEEYLYGCLIEEDIDILENFDYLFIITSLDDSDDDLGMTFTNVFVSKDVTYDLLKYREQRKEKYNIVVVPTVYDEDNEPMSSTKIRNAE